MLLSCHLQNSWIYLSPVRLPFYLSSFPIHPFDTFALSFTAGDLIRSRGMNCGREPGWAPAGWSWPTFPKGEPRSFAFIPLDGKAEWWEMPDLRFGLQTQLSALYLPSGVVLASQGHAHAAGE